MKENNFFNKYLLTALALSTYPVTILFTSNFQNTNLFMYVIPLVVVYLITLVLIYKAYIFVANPYIKLDKYFST